VGGKRNEEKEKVLVSFHTFWGLTVLMDENCKMVETNP
jgi:hypothetical protein